MYDNALEHSKVKNMKEVFWTVQVESDSEYRG